MLVFLVFYILIQHSYCVIVRVRTEWKGKKAFKRQTKSLFGIHLCHCLIQKKDLGVTQTDFVLNKSSLHSQSKKACAAGRLDGMEERGRISVLISGVLTNANTFERACVTQCFCAISKREECEGSLVTLATSLIHVSYLTWLQTHTGTHPSATKSLAAALTACQRLDSQRAARVAWHHHNSKFPAGSFGTRSSSSVLPVPGEWQEVTKWWEGRAGREAIDLRLILKIYNICHSGHADSHTKHP